ncbi:hypothetical protein K402DRAFT_389688 [Aulographum hederae CBS 113979]|uniref:ADP-ribose 1''-phosphate phosphatase n=1 Tax=Aulographum hederae CBS 113979 TaxID=1176131 RepID=A0A6G1HCK5_9PEZI|nr:hypothetical protein K402DRAFT_389688 [Aulographum hederae CBS 113979]
MASNKRPAEKEKEQPSRAMKQTKLNFGGKKQKMAPKVQQQSSPSSSSPTDIPASSSTSFKEAVSYESGSDPKISKCEDDEAGEAETEQMGNAESKKVEYFPGTKILVVRDGDGKPHADTRMSGGDERVGSPTGVDGAKDDEDEDKDETSHDKPSSNTQDESLPETPAASTGPSSPTSSKPPPPPITNPTSTPPRHFRIIELTGDIFIAPPNSVIIHACNTLGSWSAGIALAFRKTYPSAYTTHAAHCKSSSPSSLISTAQLIPPPRGAWAPRKEPTHWIGCLFTSKRFGKRKDSPDEILAATGPAMRDLLRQMREKVREGKVVAEIRICRINSGLFAVEWERTREVLEGLEWVEGLPEEIYAYER